MEFYCSCVDILSVMCHHLISLVSSYFSMHVLLLELLVLERPVFLVACLLSGQTDIELSTPKTHGPYRLLSATGAKPSICHRMRVDQCLRQG